jgi:hypothetical protein
MSAGHLLSPAKCYFYLPVTAVCTVADNKIVAYSFPMIAFSMPFVEYGGVSEIRCRVMNNYSPPALL